MSNDPDDDHNDSPNPEPDKALIKRDARGRLIPGHANLNPAGPGDAHPKSMPRIGRPAKKGIERWMREFIAEQLEKDDAGDTMNGWQALTKMMFDIAMGRKPPGIGEVEIKIRDRQEAVRFLFDRAYGKAKIHIESDNIITASPLVNINTDALDARELDMLEQYVEGIAKKMTDQAVAVALADEVIEETERADPTADDLDELALANRHLDHDL